MDDDHVYKRHIVERYAAALRAEPDTVFTVQSPPSQFIGWRPRMPIAYGARGVGMRLDLALDGALSEYAAAASIKEPTCRVVDDIVVSAFFASRNVTVRDVPYFSFDNRPWRHVNQIRLLSKQHALRSDKRDAQNARCHDALVGRDATASGSAAGGAATAEEWFSRGIRTVAEAVATASLAVAHNAAEVHDPCLSEWVLKNDGCFNVYKKEGQQSPTAACLDGAAAQWYGGAVSELGVVLQTHTVRADALRPAWCWSGGLDCRRHQMGERFDLVAAG